MIEQVYDGSDCYPEIVREHWLSHPNYLIEYNEKVERRSGARYIFVAMIFGFRIQKAFFANAF